MNHIITPCVTWRYLSALSCWRANKSELRWHEFMCINVASIRFVYYEMHSLAFRIQRRTIYILKIHEAFSHTFESHIKATIHTMQIYFSLNRLKRWQLCLVVNRNVFNYIIQYLKQCAFRILIICIKVPNSILLINI